MNKSLYKIKSNVCSQIYLNFFCPFMNKADDDTCHFYVSEDREISRTKFYIVEF